MKVELTSLAVADLEQIGDRIALRNPARAVSFIQELREKASKLGDFPHAGSPRPQWGDDIRFELHGRYLIIYRVKEQAVQILRVVHGGRDLDTLLMPPPKIED
jgi:toxin ParE1/3/4